MNLQALASAELIEGLKLPEWRVRLTAAKALDKIGPEAKPAVLAWRNYGQRGC